MAAQKVRIRNDMMPCCFFDDRDFTRKTFMDLGNPRVLHMVIEAVSQLAKCHFKISRYRSK